MLASDFYVRDWDQISLNNIVSEFCLKLRMITGERRLRWEGDYGGKGFMARMVITVKRAITVASVTMVVRKTTAGKETIGKKTTVGKGTRTGKYPMAEWTKTESLHVPGQQRISLLVINTLKFTPFHHAFSSQAFSLIVTKVSKGTCLQG